MGWGPERLESGQIQGGIPLAHPIAPVLNFVSTNMLTRRSFTVIRSLATAAIGAAVCAYSATHIAAQGGITITGCPGSTCILKAGPDFATDTFAAPWDFQQRSDVAIDPAQVTGLTNLTIGGGMVGGTALGSGSHFAVLEQPWNAIINPGKTGQKFPIASTHYTKLAVKYTGDA